jgi:predicted transcriptional regulator YdeE
VNVQLVHKPLYLDLYGFSGTAINQCYGDTGFTLMNKMWESVKPRGLKNKGINVWVYESNDRMFAGVELEEVPCKDTGLERKVITLSKYAYHKHIGPYSMLRQVNQAMYAELTKRGLSIVSPCLEVYGHWDPDESKLETELLMALR